MRIALMTFAGTALMIGVLHGFGKLTIAEASLPQESISEVHTFPIAGNRPARYVRTMVATAYSSDPWQTDDTPFIPADGSNLLTEFETYGAVYAIASNDLPLGAIVRLPDLFGDQRFVVRDRMNRRYTGKGRLDIYMAVPGEDGELDLDASRDAARAFGIKRTRVEIL
jgi:3D (Asp-Asp-Asp) domain-containing protein